MSYFYPDFSAQTARVYTRFGPSIRSTISNEIVALNCSRALVLSTPEQAGMAMDLASVIGDLTVGLYSKAAMHTPLSITEDAVSHARHVEADCLVAIGGGSTIGLSKAIALRTGLPQIAIPTTYAGSEATPILGQTENNIKTTISDPKIQPSVVLYDAELICSLPLSLTVTSALNAMAHAIEGLYAQNRNPISTILAVEGLRAFQNSLPKVLANPDDLYARGESLYGAWLCGTVLGQVGMALHHKLCHTLGGSFNLPHAETHAIILPYAIHYNAQAASRELKPICEIFGGTSPGQAIYDFSRSLNAPKSLRELGLKETDLDRAANLATQKPYWNPRAITQPDIRRLLQSAWAGDPPH